MQHWVCSRLFKSLYASESRVLTFWGTVHSLEPASVPPCIVDINRQHLLRSTKRSQSWRQGLSRSAQLNLDRNEHCKTCTAWGEFRVLSVSKCPLRASPIWLKANDKRYGCDGKQAGLVSVYVRGLASETTSRFKTDISETDTTHNSAPVQKCPTSCCWVAPWG